MRRQPILVLVLALVSGACAGDADQQAAPTSTTALAGRPAACEELPTTPRRYDLSAAWAVGDRATLGVHHVRTGIGTDRGEQSTTATITVEEATGRGYTLSWEEPLIDERVFDPLDDVGLTDDERAVLAELRDLASLSTRYRTDRFGRFVELENADDVLGAAEAYVDQLREVNDTAAERPLQETVDALGETLRHPQLRQLFLASITKTIASYHALYGGLVGPGRPMTFDVELPNPVGGPSLPARQVLRLDEPADARGCVVASLVTRPKPGPTRRVITEFVASLAPDGGLEAEEIAAQLEDLDLSERVTARWDPGSTWMYRVEARSLVSGGSRTKDETYTYELLSTSP